MKTFPNPNAIKLWAHTDEIHFLGGEAKMPYIQKDGQFYYFGWNGKELTLLMTSSRDLQDAK